MVLEDEVMWGGVGGREDFRRHQITLRLQYFPFHIAHRDFIPRKVLL